MNIYLASSNTDGNSQSFCVHKPISETLLTFARRHPAYNPNEHLTRKELDLLFVERGNLPSKSLFFFFTYPTINLKDF